MRPVKERGPKEGSYGSSCKCGLTVRQRQRLCDLVAAGVTITAAALVVGCSSRRHRSGSTVDARSRHSLDRSSRPTVPRRTPTPSSRRSCAPGGAARGTARDRLGARDRGLDGACGAASPRRLPPPRGARARRSSATSARDPAAGARRLQELGRILEARPPRHRRPPRAGEGQGRLAAPVRGDRRPRPAWLRPRLPRRDRRRAPPPSCNELVRFYRAHGIGSSASSPTTAPASSAAGPACAAHAHRRSRHDPSPADQRKGRALHPHTARALGLRLPVPPRAERSQPSGRRSTSTIASAPTALSQASRRSTRQQPPWDKQLARVLPT